MPAKVADPDLVGKRDDQSLSRGEQTVLALLDMGSVALQEFQDLESHEHLIRDLADASNNVSSEAFEY